MLSLLMSVGPRQGSRVGLHCAVLRRDPQLAVSKADQELEPWGCVTTLHLLRDRTTTDLSCFLDWSLRTSLYVTAAALKDSLGIATMVLPWDVDFWRPKLLWLDWLLGGVFPWACYFAAWISDLTLTLLTKLCCSWRPEQHTRALVSITAICSVLSLLAVKHLQ